MRHNDLPMMLMEVYKLRGIRYKDSEEAAWAVQNPVILKFGGL
jgi:hypothetical protein